MDINELKVCGKDYHLVCVKVDAILDRVRPEEMSKVRGSVRKQCMNIIKSHKLTERGREVMIGSLDMLIEIREKSLT